MLPAAALAQATTSETPTPEQCAANAQLDGCPTTNADGTPIEEGAAIVVTGSRIRRAGFETLEPATVISSEYLSTRGLTNAADALNEIPGFGVGVTPEGGQAGFGVGANFANRFGLGTARTLTLVNGRRFVSTNPPTIFGNGPGLQVDLNVIPTELVDRIENLTIGGAPTYGTDAIAGTVNVILKKNFEGLTVSGLGGITERGDNGRYNLSFVAGSNYNEGRGNITIAGSYDLVNGVLAIDRQRFQEGIGTGTNPTVGSPTSLLPGRSPATDGRLNPNIPFNTPGVAGNSDGIPNSVFIRNTRIFSLTGGGLLLPGLAAVPAGQNPNVIANGLPRGFGAANTLLQFDSSGNLVPYNPGVPFGPQNSSGGDGFNLNETSQLTSKLQRIVGTVQANYEVFDDIRVFFEGNFYRAQALELIDQPIFNATLFGGLSQPLTFQTSDPRLSASNRAQLTALGATSFRLSRASRDLVTNNASGTTEVLRGVAGIGGDFGLFGKTFNFEASANYGQSDSIFFSTTLDQQRFVNAINVTTNGAGQIVCNPNVTAATNVAPGAILPIADPSCVPLDVFGEGRASAAARAYVTGVQGAQARLEQQVYNINFGASDIVNLWSGPVGFNAGFEHRVESGSFTPNAFQQAGRGRSVPIGANSGSFQTNEVFGEIAIPLVSPDNGVPLIYSLDLEGKVRYVDNSVNGGFTAYTYGARYTPFQGLQIRGNYTRSLRAPNITELFTPRQNIFNTFPDPCDTVNLGSGTRPAVRQANCAAFFSSYGITPGTFNSTARVATIAAVSGGDPTLANEKGSSYTFGVVLQPRFLPRFRMAVDWNRITVTGNIVSLSNANIAEGCYDNTDFDAANVDTANAFCSLFTRVRGGPFNGQLVNDAANPGLRQVFVNGAFISFQGLTAEAQYNFPLSFVSEDSRIDLSGTFFYLDRITSSNNAVTVNAAAGQLGSAAPFNGSAQFSGQANIGYSDGTFGLDLQGNYQSDQRFNNLNTVETQDILQLNDYITFNLTASVKVQDNSILRFVTTNLFDVEAPFPAGVAGFGTYDYLGRRFAVSFEHKF